MAKTKAFVEEYEGKPTLAIWEVDEKGNKSGKWFVISFGTKKAKAILAHIDDIKNFDASFGGEHKKKAKKVKHDDD